MLGDSLHGPTSPRIMRYGHGHTQQPPCALPEAWCQMCALAGAATVRNDHPPPVRIIIGRHALMTAVTRVRSCIILLHGDLPYV